MRAIEKKGLTIIVPIFNEEKGIENTIKSLIKLSNSIDFNFEIILVNDGSVDDTKNIILNGIKDIKYMRLIDHDFNRGYGESLKTGIKSANFSHIAITDADETYPNHRIPEFYLYCIENELDMVVGARVGKNVKIPTIRKPAKWFLNQLANYLAEYKIPDLNSGLRVFKKETLAKFLKILPSGFSFTTTISLAMLTNGHNVRYKTIEYYNRAGSSKIRPIYDTLNFIQLIIRTVLLFRPLKVFIPLSLIMFLFSFSLIIYRIFFGESFGVIATVFFVGAIQVLAVGMLADLIDRRI